MEATATGMLEREGELRGIAQALDAACEGRGGLVLVEGAAGIGKTLLLEAARSCARERGMVVLSARASELDREFPFGVVRQLFEPLVVGREADRRESLLRGAAGLVAPLLGAEIPVPGAPVQDMDPALARFHALYWLTVNLAEEAPAALVVDDAHWADTSSLRFLEFLIPRLDELPVLVAIAARPPEHGSNRQAIDVLATDALTLVLRPAPLSRGAVDALVAAELGGPADPDFSAACRHATGGNPLLLRELLRELAGEGIVPSAERVPVVRQLAPATVARAVLLRLARLGGEASELARAVAVLGDGAPLRRAAALAGLGQERADDLAVALAQAGIFAASRPLAFAHPILRAAVYADIDPGERARAHRRAATLISGEGAAANAVAVHLLATEPGEDPYVVETLRAAAAAAVSRGAASTAVSCLRRAIAEPPPAEERGRVTFELASAELHAGEPGSATAHFDEAYRITPDPRDRCTRWWEQVIALQAIGRSDDSFALRERMVKELSDADEQLALSIEASLISSACVDLSRLGWARERLERHRERLSTGAAAEWRLLAAQAWLDAFYGDASAAEVADVAESALAGRRATDTRGATQVTAFFMAVDVLLLADRVEPARRVLDQAIDTARRRGSAPSFAFASGWRSFLFARAGELAEAEADARRCAELSLPQGWFMVAPPMLGYVLGALLDRGELDDAARILDRSGISASGRDDDVTRHPVLHARARIRAAHGDVAGGRADVAELTTSRARWNTYPTLAPAVLYAPELAGDDRAAQRRHVEQMASDARQWNTPRAVGMALRAAGLVEGGADGLELLRDAASTLEASPARLEYARALIDLGAALRRANRRTDAREPLRRALDVADECGAAPLAARARQELRVAGGRPRRPRLSGADALTASERRIATMAAGGLSNPEIAQALFITKKTVEAHLGSAYRKLDIRSRSQLAAVLRRDE